MGDLISISAKNFKAIREAKIAFEHGVAAIVGRNGVGKSTILEVLRFLQETFTSGSSAFSSRGEDISGVIRNKDESLTAELELTVAVPIEMRREIIALHFTNSEEEREDVLKGNLLSYISYRVAFNTHSRLEQLLIGNLRSEFEDVVVAEQLLDIHGKSREKYSVKSLSGRYHNMSLEETLSMSLEAHAHPQAETKNWGFEHSLDNIGYGREQWLPSLNELIRCQVRATTWLQPNRTFDNTTEIKNNIIALKSDFSNIVAVVDALGSRQPDLLEEVTRDLQTFLPHLESIRSRSLTSSTHRTIALYEKLGDPLKHYFTMEQLSFGTKAILGFLIAIATNPEESIICIEEPELHLHPSAQVLLAKAFLKHTAKHTFLISTHSATIVAELPVNSVYLASRDMANATTLEQMGEDENIRRKVISELGIKPSHAFEANALILVEGSYDAIVYETWAGLFGLGNVDFLDTEGWTNMHYYAAVRMDRKRRQHTHLFGILDGDTHNQEHQRRKKATVETFNKLGMPENLLTISHTHIEGFLLQPQALVKMHAGLKEEEIMNYLAVHAGEEPKDVLKLCFSNFGLGYYSRATVRILAQQFSSPPEEIKEFFSKIKAACEHFG